jgi:ribosomal protein S12 methylthiotransferase
VSNVYRNGVLPRKARMGEVGCRTGILAGEMTATEHETLPASPLQVAVVTLGCARNEVDSEELAGRLEAGGFVLVDDPEDADTVVVNTCGFVEAAKKDSVDTLLEAADLKASAGHGGKAQAVVAVGCLAERYGKDLAESLPEADAVLGFDDYPDIAAKLRAIVAGETHHPHTPSDRRLLLPISPIDRQSDRDASGISVPGHFDVPVVADTTEIGAGAPATGPRAVRRRLDAGPMAPLKLASGCDRRCTFCAIPAFRGSFVSRRPSDVVHEAQWLATQGVKELFLVSENSTSYGKDLGDLRLLETMLPELTAIDGIERVRVSYLQPAETRPGLIEAIASTPGVVPYFDLSFQHASATVLRRMRRFGDPESFLGLLETIRGLAPLAGVRSNVIVGFPGETEEELQTLCDFLEAARMDVTGVFGYSDEDGTEAAGFAEDTKLDEDEIRARTEQVTALVEQLNAQRAEERIGEEVVVLVESVDDCIEGSAVEGRAAHQGPEVDGTTTVLGADGAQVGDLLTATVTGTDGVDLVAQLTGGRA